MNEHDQSDGDLIRLDPDGNRSEETIRRLPLGTTVDKQGIDEKTLGDIFFRFPKALPIASIDASYGDVVPICRELRTQAGPVDALYVNAHGRITLVEFKLWRNPDARRKVIAQILDYARDIAEWGYDDLQRRVLMARRTTMKRNERENVLFELLRAHAPDINEAEFVDNVTRHLRRGEFLLLIIGDGIREGTEKIVNFIRQHSGLHFNLALIEAALYPDSDRRIIVQPRVYWRTKISHRVVVEGDRTRNEVERTKEDVTEILSDEEAENFRYWTEVLRDFSFSDSAVEVPSAIKDSSNYVKVTGSGHNDSGLSFVGSLFQKKLRLECYLTCRKGYLEAEHAYEQIRGSFEDLKRELGSDLTQWESSTGRPRIGFIWEVKPPFRTNDGKLNDFDGAVQWMREHLDRLVSGLHQHLQDSLSAGS